MHGASRDALDVLSAELGLESNVMLLDSMPEPLVREHLAWADVFALACVVAKSGDRDGIPVVLMEAMANQLPVVSTEVSGIPELVAHEKSGLLVPPGDPERMADALERLAGDADLRHAMGVAGRTAVEAGFVVGANARRLLEVFRASVGEDKAGARS